MTRNTSGEGQASQLGPVVDDDVFITALSQGIDPTGGKDPLAGLLLELREDVERPMPAAPVVDNVVSLSQRRQRRQQRRGVSPWVAGLTGAAAATVVVAGGGAAVLNVAGGHQDPAVVELASTLEELEVANDEGDTATARALLEQARSLVAALHAADQEAEKAEKSGESEAPKPRPLPTVTVTQTPELSSPTTVTETVTVTATPEAPAVVAPEQPQAPVATTSARPNPLDPPAPAPQPSQQPTQTVQPTAAPEPSTAAPQGALGEPQQY